MVYVVLCAVVGLGIVSLAASIAGICSYNDPYTPPSFLNLMAGTAATAFGAAIIICAIYGGLPLSVEAYAVPVGFCVVGVPFLIAGGFQRYQENQQVAA